MELSNDKSEESVNGAVPFRKPMPKSERLQRLLKKKEKTILKLQKEVVSTKAELKSNFNERFGGLQNEMEGLKRMFQAYIPNTSEESDDTDDDLHYQMAESAKGRELEEKTRQLVEKDRQLVDQDLQIERKDRKLEKKRQKLANLGKLLEEKDAELEEKNAELEEKNAELAEKDAELADKDEEIKRKVAEITKLQHHILETIRLSEDVLGLGIVIKEESNSTKSEDEGNNCNPGTSARIGEQRGILKRKGLSETTTCAKKLHFE